MFVPLTIDQMAERMGPEMSGLDKAQLFYWATHPRYATHVIAKKSYEPIKSITLDMDEDVVVPAPKVRLISEPMPGLMRIQKWILEFILNPACASLLPCVHGCVQGKSTVTNALPHVGALWKIHMDVKDFFPTVTAPRVFGLFRKVFLYDDKLSWLLANLCTWKMPQQAGEPTEEAGARSQSLPQGAPTSPAIANLIATGLDIKMIRLSRSTGATYTRYVDDLTFSFRHPLGKEAREGFVRNVGSLVANENFVINESKTSVISRRSRMVVTGIVVNSKPGIPREFRSRLRASLHHSRLELPTADPSHVIQGRLAYVKMVNEAQAERALR